MQIIKEIKIIENVEESYTDNHGSVYTTYSKYIGYSITTDKQIIEMLISNGSECCENYGHICSEDDFDKFIGAKILKIYRVDQSLKSHKIDLDAINVDGESGLEDAVFINIETDRGLLQFVIYNFHNGYYGHYVIIKSNELKLTEKI